MEEYQRSGKAIRNGAGQVTLPNGAFIPRQYQGATLRDGFDNFYNQNPALLQVAQASRAPEVTMNFVSVGVELVEEEEDKDAVVEAELLRMLAAVAQSRAKKQAKFEGVVVSKPTSRKGPPGIPAVAGSSSAAPAAGTKTVPAEEVKGEGREPGQFKYQAPAEDKELIQAVIDRSMESQVTMSQKELLAISPDVRRHMKEVTTSKRVVQNTVEALLATAEVQAIGTNEQRPSAVGMVVGVDCLPLRCIDGLVDGKYRWSALWTPERNSLQCVGPSGRTCHGICSSL